MENNQAQLRTMSTKHSDHLANERTFLAWIRTSIAIMVFGFVIEKFKLILGITHESTRNWINGLSTCVGILLVALGVIICLLAFVKYKKVENEINKNIFKSSILLEIMLMLIVFLVGLFLTVYLINNI